MAKAIGRATGNSIHGKPERFTPRISDRCALT
jgi:hypothetical protein